MPATERRQGRRVEILPRPEFRLARRVRVRLVDISLGGALVASEEPIGTGTTGQLRFPLGRGRFEALVVVNREEVQPSPQPSVLTATSVVSVEHESQELLEEFLGRSE
jgi:c-di-GMP-binding flagellar brake protein YcgR